MEELFDIPDHPMYKATKSGEIISFKFKNPRPLKQKPQKNARCRKQVRLDGQHYITHRIIMAAKLGRWLKPWEQVRHIDGNRNNNHMDNLTAGCAVNNMLDDIENGTRQTDAANIDLAIQRLKVLRGLL